MGVRSVLRTLFLTPEPEPERNVNPYSLNQFIADYNSAFTFNGIRYGTMVGTEETIEDSFEGIISGAVKSDGVVFGCMLARLSVFSDARFVFRELRNGTPGDLIGSPDGRNPASTGLRLLQRPWIGGTTGDLLARMIQDADIAGNAFIARRQNQLVRLRPDWVTIVAETPGDASLWHPDAQVLGYIYNPGGPATDDRPIAFPREEVAHFAPFPDPQQRFRGMSWLEPVLTEILSDKSMTRHKQMFFDQGATVNLMLKYDPSVTKEVFKFAKESFAEQHEGIGNAYKTLHLLGAEPVMVGSTMEQMAFTDVQGKGETRIALAAGVPAVILGISEGLQGSALNQGNYSSARRQFADRTIRPLWRNACASLAQIVPAPPNAELWYDDTDVAFLREDMTDAATVMETNARSAKTLIDAGYEPDSVTDAITSGDLKRLKHSNLVSVQLQPPGQKPEPPAAPPQQPPEDMPMQNSAEVIYLEQRANRAELEAAMLSAALERQAVQPQLPITIHNHPADVTVNPSDVNVDVQTPEMRVEPTFEVHQPEITVNTPDVNVTTPPVNVDVQTPEVRVDVTTPETQVNVEPAAVTNEVHVDVEPTPLEVRVDSPVNVEVPEQLAPEVSVNVEPTEVNITMPKTRKKVIRDEAGKVVGMEEEIAGDLDDGPTVQENDD